MRKLMLAGTAILGATSGIAMAQVGPANGNLTFAPTQGQLALPWGQGPATNNNNNTIGRPSTYVGGAAFGKNAVPTPGTVVIRLNGRVEVNMLAEWSTNNQVLGAKTNPITFSSYMRLYPAVDGMATNGLRYGAAIELRENFPGSSAQQTPSLTPAPSGSTYSSGQTVYVRKAFTYLANDYLGLVRFGNGDGVIGLFDPCIFSSDCWDVGITGLNGGQAQVNGVTGAFAVPYVWLAQAGVEYSNTKIVYLSPQFFGFDFGVQYAPSMGNGFSTCTTAGGIGMVPAQANCNSETTGTDATRWYNQVAVGARYQGNFGPVAVGAYAVYETAGKESFFGAPASFARGLAAGNRFDNMSFVSAAAYVTVDTGIGRLTYSIDYIGGALNGQLAMRPTGGVPENAILTGLMYINGPVTLGANVGVVDSQGSNSLTSVSQRHEFEMSVGGNYRVAPGLYLVGEYMFVQRHQGGFDFLTGANGAGATGVAGTTSWKAGKTQDVHGQALMFSTVVTW
jgi:hypothetical protein